MTGLPAGGTRGGRLGRGGGRSRRRVPSGRTGSGSSSRRGMRTKARWCMRGWGTVRRSSCDRQVVDQEDVDVDRPWAPADVAGAAERGLDAVDGGEEVVRLERRVDLGDDVQEVGLLGAADGVGLPHAGACDWTAMPGSAASRSIARWSVASRSPRFDAQTRGRRPSARYPVGRRWRPRRRRRCPGGRRRSACGPRRCTRATRSSARARRRSRRPSTRSGRTTAARRSRGRSR